MTFAKYTIIGGYRPPKTAREAAENPPQRFTPRGEDGAPLIYVNILVHGHWRPESAIKMARRIGIIRDMRMTYLVSDLSGKGRDSEEKPIELRP